MNQLRTVFQRFTLLITCIIAVIGAILVGFLVYRNIISPVQTKSLCSSGAVANLTDTDINNEDIQKVCFYSQKLNNQTEDVKLLRDIINGMVQLRSVRDSYNEHIAAEIGVHNPASIPVFWLHENFPHYENAVLYYYLDVIGKIEDDRLSQAFSGKSSVYDQYRANRDPRVAIENIRKDILKNPRQNTLSKIEDIMNHLAPYSISDTDEFTDEKKIIMSQGDVEKIYEGYGFSKDLFPSAENNIKNNLTEGVKKYMEIVKYKSGSSETPASEENYLDTIASQRYVVDEESPKYSIEVRYGLSILIGIVYIVVVMLTVRYIKRDTRKHEGQDGSGTKDVEQLDLGKQKHPLDNQFI
jgi:hypothetical protein